MVSIRNDKTGEGEIDRSQSSIDSYWKISVESNVDHIPQHFRISFVSPNEKLSIENH